MNYHQQEDKPEPDKNWPDDGLKWDAEKSNEDLLIRDSKLLGLAAAVFIVVGIVILGVNRWIEMRG